MTEPEKANQTLRDFDEETNAYNVMRGLKRLDLVSKYHEAKEKAERLSAPTKGSDAPDRSKA